MRLDMHVGTCINRTDKLAAECRVAVVYYRYRHFAYHLIGINKGIYQRVGQRDKQEENKYALVFENGFQFLLAYMELPSLRPLKLRLNDSMIEFFLLGSPIVRFH